MPICKSVYPGFMMANILSDWGDVFVNAVPLEPDYVKPAYMGVSYSYLIITGQLTQALAS